MRRTMTTMKPASPTWGSRLILYGTFALILTSGFAAYMQIDVSRAFLDGIIKTNRKMGIPVFQYLFTMFNESEPVRKLAARLMFLLGLVILSFILIGQRKKTAACVIALPVCGLTYWAGCLLELYSLEPSNLIRFVVGLPLLLVAVGCILQIAHAVRLANARPQYQRPGTPRRPGRFAPPVKRTVPEKTRQYRDAPGATRMLPNATAPAVQEVRQQPPAPARRMEQPVPDRTATHLGQPAQQPEQPHYQWKTIKQNDHQDVISQGR